MGARINLFAAWFLIPQTLVMGWIAASGRIVLELAGMNTTEGDIPGRLIGSLLLLAGVYLVLHFRRSLPPEGNPAGKGYKIGQRLVLTANLLGSLFVVFQYTFPLIADANVHMLLDGFTNAFGYWAMAVWVVGFSFLYQSALPAQQA